MIHWGSSFETSCHKNQDLILTALRGMGARGKVAHMLSNKKIVKNHFLMITTGFLKGIGVPMYLLKDQPQEVIVSPQRSMVGPF